MGNWREFILKKSVDVKPFFTWAVYIGESIIAYSWKGWYRVNHWISQCVKYLNSRCCPHPISPCRSHCPWLWNTHRHTAHCYRWVFALLWVGQCELKTTAITGSPSSVASAYLLCKTTLCALAWLHRHCALVTSEITTWRILVHCVFILW